MFLAFYDWNNRRIYTCLQRKMSRRPSIELTNLQTFINPLDKHLFETVTVKPPPHLNNLINKVQKSKENKKYEVAKTHSKPTGNFTKPVKREYSYTKKTQDSMQNSLIVHQLQPSKDRQYEHVEARQERSISMPVDSKQPNQAFRIHHSSFLKNNRGIGSRLSSQHKYRMVSKEPKQKTDYLNVQGKKFYNSEHGHLSQRDSSNSDPSPDNKSKEKTHKANFQDQYRLFQKSNKIHKETTVLMNRVQGIVKANSLFKLPKDKAKVLEAKLRSTISSDLEGKRLNKQFQSALSRMTAGRVVFKPTSVEKQSCVIGQMKPKNKWKTKQAEQLSLLRGRMIEQPKNKLVLR